MADEKLEVLITARDMTHGALQGLHGALGSLSSLAGGALVAGFAAATVAAGGLAAGLTFAINEAVGAEDALAGLDAVLRTSTRAALNEAEEYAAASRKVTQHTRMEEDELLKLQDELAAATGRLEEMQITWDAQAEHTAIATHRMEDARAEVADLQNQIAAGSEMISSTLAKDLGLVEPPARVSRQALIDLAGGMQETTKYSDEMVMGAEKILLTFRSIGADVFPQVTELAADMSTVFGQDLQSSAIQLGKALQDPISGVTALRRIGVVLTQQQEDQIKVFMESGDILSAQKVILAEVANEVGGAAKAAGETSSGQWEIFKNQISDISEAIGGEFLPVLADLMKTGGPILLEFLRGIVPYAKDFASTLGPIITEVGAFIKNIQEGYDPLFLFQVAMRDLLPPEVAESVNRFVDDLLNSPLAAALKDLVAAFQEQTPALQEEASKIGKFLQEGMGPQGALLLQNITSTVQSMADIWREHGDEIISVLGFVFRTILVIVGGAVNLLVGLVAAGMKLLSGDWQGAWEIVKTTVTGILTSIATLFGTNLENLRVTCLQLAAIVLFAMLSVGNAVRDNITGLRDKFVDGFNGAVDGVRTFVDKFREMGAGIVNGLITGVRDNMQKFIDYITEQVSSIVQNVLNALGIGSPSKVFADIGQNMMAGMAQGIGAGATMPQMAVANAVAGVTNIRSGGGDYTLRNYGTIQFNVQPNTPSAQKLLEDFSRMG